MKINPKMRALYDAASKRRATVPVGLTDLLRDGFVSDEDCIFLRSCYALYGRRTRNLFPDDIGYECFVNKIHIDDYTHGDVVSVAATGLAFMDMLGADWGRYGLGGTIRIILTVENETDSTIRFHLVRADQTWLDEGFADSETTQATAVADVVSVQN